MAPLAIIVLSMLMPTSSPMVRMAEPAMLLISVCKYELKALFIENADGLASVRYMPDTNMVTATLPLPSTDMVFSSS